MAAIGHQLDAHLVRVLAAAFLDEARRDEDVALPEEQQQRGPHAAIAVAAAQTATKGAVVVAGRAP